MNNLRKYGRPPFRIAVVHGGPGAAGEMASVAEELADGVLEPLQTADTVAGQLQELENILINNGEYPYVLIGYSWGAWLSLLFTARFPYMVKKLILVSSGPLTEEYTSDIMETRLKKLDQEQKARIFKLMQSLNDPLVIDKDKVFSELGELFSLTDSYDPLPDNRKKIISYQIYQQVWLQAQELRSSGHLLECARQIQCPVTALHGDHDPHPYQGIREPLSLVLQDFHFYLLKNCGHTPWLEKQARTEFYNILMIELNKL